MTAEAVRVIHATAAAQTAGARAEHDLEAENMLEVNKPILADDPYRLLQFERGIFDVVSPTGRRMRVVCPMECPADAGQTYYQSTQDKRGWWRIEKIACA